MVRGVPRSLGYALRHPLRANNSEVIVANYLPRICTDGQMLFILYKSLRLAIAKTPIPAYILLAELIYHNNALVEVALEHISEKIAKAAGKNGTSPKRGKGNVYTTQTKYQILVDKLNLVRCIRHPSEDISRNATQVAILLSRNDKFRDIFKDIVAIPDTITYEPMLAVTTIVEELNGDQYTEIGRINPDGTVVCGPCRDTVIDDSVKDGTCEEEEGVEEKVLTVKGGEGHFQEFIATVSNLHSTSDLGVPKYPMLDTKISTTEVVEKNLDNITIKMARTLTIVKPDSQHLSELLGLGTKSSVNNSKSFKESVETIINSSIIELRKLNPKGNYTDKVDGMTIDADVIEIKPDSALIEYTINPEVEPDIVTPAVVEPVPIDGTGPDSDPDVLITTNTDPIDTQGSPQEPYPGVDPIDEEQQRSTFRFTTIISMTSDIPSCTEDSPCVLVVVDDTPKNNEFYTSAARSLGVQVFELKSTTEFYKFINRNGVVIESYREHPEKIRFMTDRARPVEHELARGKEEAPLMDYTAYQSVIQKLHEDYELRDIDVLIFAGNGRHRIRAMHKPAEHVFVTWHEDIALQYVQFGTDIEYVF